ncbi:transposase [Streptomyces sp. NPDC046557]|uniref:transposase n=1 Tax=Streptomyces sp. NPDC046557 TaxID=3155372 RepID=UPI0033C7BDA3
MAEYQNIRTGRHGIFALHAHLVFVTKYRHQVFTDVHLKRMEEITRATPGATTVARARVRAVRIGRSFI